MRKFLLFAVLSSGLAQAQSPGTQPEKESTTDLRNTSILFSVIEQTGGKAYFLERTSGMDYFLRHKTAEDEVIRKISSRDALEADKLFAAKFLRCQYEIADLAGDCVVSLQLYMKGEELKICQKDSEKEKEISTFLDSLKKFL